MVSNGKKTAVRYLGIYIGHDTEECKRLNWDTKIENLTKTLDMWKMRNITLFGKVLLIKSLAISQLVYSASILSIPDNTVPKINKIVYAFLFNNHCRIKRNTLIGSTEEGGIKMIDIECNFYALKAAWISRILDTCNPISSIFSFYCQRIGLEPGYLIGQTYCEKVKIFPCLEKLPEFYIDVILSYNKCKTKKSVDRMTYNEFLMQPIWGNRMFTFENKCLYFRNWCESKILYVKDICVNGRVISERDLLLKLSIKSNWIAEYCIIKKVFRKMLHNYDQNFTPTINIKLNCTITHKNKIFSAINQKSKFFYSILVGKKIIQPLAIKFWKNHFDLDASEVRWKNICMRKVILCPVKKLAEFNYKMLNNILPCGYYVNKWNKTVQPKCSKCDIIHDVKHMLFDCNDVNLIWQKVGETLNINFTWKKIVFGFGSASKFARNSIKLNNITSLLCFLFYKMWIQKGSCFNITNLKYFLLKELDFYGKIQKNCTLIFIELSHIEKVYDAISNVTRLSVN